MEARAVARHIRMSPRKARLVIDAIRGKDVNAALKIVALSSKKSALPIRKTLESAIANAESHYDVDVDKLFVVRACVDMGKSLRRMQPRAYGRADVVRHHTSHVTIVVGDRGRT
jgi:large subunit ribosomal protein L22